MRAIAVVTMTVMVGMVGCASAPASKTPSWMVGAWRHLTRNVEVFVEVSNVIWGVELNPFDGEAVIEIDGRQATLVWERGGAARYERSPGGNDHEVKFTGNLEEISFVRTGDELTRWHQGGNDGTWDEGFATEVARSPELEAIDTRFAADSASRGADAWVAITASDGAFRDKPIVGAVAIHDTITHMLARGTLTWRPVTSGVLRDRGFTVGTYEFTPLAPAKPSTGTYCTVWKREQGAWKVALDLGS